MRQRYVQHRPASQSFVTMLAHGDTWEVCCVASITSKHDTFTVYHTWAPVQPGLGPLPSADVAPQCAREGST
jgi:hypothetical protein